jgi:hypothetical protein
MAHSTGAKLGTRIAMLVSKSVVLTNTKMAGVKHKLAMAIFHSISDTISEEVHRTIGGVLTDMHDKLPENSPAKPLLKFMSQDLGQLQAAIGMAVGASGIFTSIGTIMNNELAPIVYEAVGSNPHLIPDAGTIAALGAKGLLGENDAIWGIEQNGISGGWAQWMITANQQYPGASDMLDMLRRGIIDEGQAYAWAQVNGMPGSAAAAYFALQNVPVSPADAALALLRGNMDAGDAAASAAAYGVSAESFQVLVNNTGEPLALMQLLEAYRRGFIDQSTLEQGILESRIRNEWIPTAVQLAYSPMSVADAVNAVVQNNLDQETAEGYAQQNGLMPGMFDILLATAGEPLSRTEMEQLYNRGLVTEAQVLQALDESRLKQKYNQYAFELHTKLLNPSTLADAVLYGAMDQNTAVNIALQLGYSESDATAMVLSASNAKMFSYRTKVVEDIAQLYEVNAMDETTAIGLITSMGWSEPEANVILQAAEYNREKRIQAAAISSIRSKYIGHHIDIDTVNTDLASIGVPQGEVAYLTNLWTIELSANIEYMTPLDISKAVAASLMTNNDAVTYLMNRGYSEADANILIQVAG